MQINTILEIPLSHTNSIYTVSRCSICCVRHDKTKRYRMECLLLFVSVIMFMYLMICVVIDIIIDSHIKRLTCGELPMGLATQKMPLLKQFFCLN